MSEVKHWNIEDLPAPTNVCDVTPKICSYDVVDYNVDYSIYWPDFDLEAMIREQIHNEFNRLIDEDIMKQLMGYITPSIGYTVKEDSKYSNYERAMSIVKE